jgi:hypothetical protein
MWPGPRAKPGTAPSEIDKAPGNNSPARTPQRRSDNVALLGRKRQGRAIRLAPAHARFGPTRLTKGHADSRHGPPRYDAGAPETFAFD